MILGRCGFHIFPDLIFLIFMYFRFLSGLLQIMRRTVTLYQRTVVFLFLIFGFNENMISADDDRQLENPKTRLDSVHKLLKDGWVNKEGTSVDVFDEKFFKEIKENGKFVKEYIFNNLKNELDVASCIFWGVAQTKGIEEAVIYLHTTKYVFTSLRYLLHDYSETKGIGKLEKELTPFATVLNSVLLHGNNKKSTTTFAGETFMCNDIKKMKKNDEIIEFHTFMPSSTDVKVAVKYAEKKIFFAAESSKDDICLYIFYNTNNPKYQPRYIAELSYEPSDAEAVYPIGATFKKSDCESEDQLKVTKEGLHLIKYDMIMCLSLVVVEKGASYCGD